MTQEVWITGLGAVTAAGDGVASLAAALYRDESVAAPSGDGRWLARAADPDVGRAGRRLDRSGRLFLAAAREAWHDAGFDAAPPAAPDRVALLEGSSVGPMGEIISTERARCRAHDTSLPAPGLLVRLMMGAGGSTFAQEHGLRGMVHALSAGSVSAALAIAEGLWKIRSGQADVVICGGSEAPLDDEIVAVFEAAGVLAPRGPTLPCRPFDAERAGTMLGEGAGVLVLESAASARSRGARAHALLCGAGLASEDGGMTRPDPHGRGVSTVVSQALAGIPLGELGWIKAHGTGTRLNDAAELHGLEAALGARLRQVPLTSLKPTLGHCLGASGAVETVAAVLSLEARRVPPTLGTMRVDGDLPPMRLALAAGAPEGPVALLLSESFGGRCAALALRAA